MGSARLRGFVFCPGGSAVWPQWWLCAVCAVGHVGCCVGGGGVTCGGKHIILTNPVAEFACVAWPWTVLQEA